MTRRACLSWNNPDEPGISIRFGTREKERIEFWEGYRDACDSQRRNRPKITGSRSGKGRRRMVHTSLKRMGYVCGGAQTVIEALMEVVGKDGTMMMPTHSWKR